MQVAVFLEFRFSKFSSKWTALSNMGRVGTLTNDISNCIFFKALGTGSGNGFSIVPNFGKWAFLIVFDSLEAAEIALSQSSWIKAYRADSCEYFALYMTPAKVHGKWDGSNPFEVEKAYTEGKPIAVLTRATIRKRKLLDFWRHVPMVSRYMSNQKNSIYRSGIGEYPLFMQATFSLWKSRKSLYDAAYGNSDHGKIVKLTRERKWYSEELFAQFTPTKIEGEGNIFKVLEQSLISAQNQD